MQGVFSRSIRVFIAAWLLLLFAFDIPQAVAVAHGSPLGTTTNPQITRQESTLASSEYLQHVAQQLGSKVSQPEGNTNSPVQAQYPSEASHQSQDSLPQSRVVQSQCHENPSAVLATQESVSLSAKSTEVPAEAIDTALRHQQPTSDHKMPPTSNYTTAQSLRAWLRIVAGHIYRLMQRIVGVPHAHVPAILYQDCQLPDDNSNYVGNTEQIPKQGSLQDAYGSVGRVPAKQPSEDVMGRDEVVVVAHEQQTPGQRAKREAHLAGQHLLHAGQLGQEAAFEAMTGAAAAGLAAGHAVQQGLETAEHALADFGAKAGHVAQEQIAKLQAVAQGVEQAVERVVHDAGHLGKEQTYACVHGIHTAVESAEHGISDAAHRSAEAAKHAGHQTLEAVHNLEQHVSEAAQHVGDVIHQRLEHAAQNARALKDTAQHACETGKDKLQGLTKTAKQYAEQGTHHLTEVAHTAVDAGFETFHRGAEASLQAATGLETVTVTAADAAVGYVSEAAHKATQAARNVTHHIQSASHDAIAAGFDHITKAAQHTKESTTEVLEAAVETAHKLEQEATRKAQQYMRKVSDVTHHAATTLNKDMKAGLEAAHKVEQACFTETGQLLNAAKGAVHSSREEIQHGLETVSTIGRHAAQYLQHGYDAVLRGAEHEAAELGRGAIHAVHEVAHTMHAEEQTQQQARDRTNSFIASILTRLRHLVQNFKHGAKDRSMPSSATSYKEHDFINKQQAVKATYQKPFQIPATVTFTYDDDASVAVNRLVMASVCNVMLPVLEMHQALLVSVSNIVNPPDFISAMVYNMPHQHAIAYKLPMLKPMPSTHGLLTTISHAALQLTHNLHHVSDVVHHAGSKALMLLLQFKPSKPSTVQQRAQQHTLQQLRYSNLPPALRDFLEKCPTSETNPGSLLSIAEALSQYTRMGRRKHQVASMSLDSSTSAPQSKRHSKLPSTAGDYTTTESLQALHTEVMDAVQRARSLLEQKGCEDLQGVSELCR